MRRSRLRTITITAIAIIGLSLTTAASAGPQTEAAGTVTYLDITTWAPPAGTTAAVPASRVPSLVAQWRLAFGLGGTPVVALRLASSSRPFSRFTNRLIWVAIYSIADGDWRAPWGGTGCHMYAFVDASSGEPIGSYALCP